MSKLQRKFAALLPERSLGYIHQMYLYLVNVASSLIPPATVNVVRYLTSVSLLLCITVCMCPRRMPAPLVGSQPTR